MQVRPGHGEALAIDMAPGATRTVSVIFGPKRNYLLPWTRQLWAGSQLRPRDELGPGGPDWFTLAAGATARIVAQTNCAAENSVLAVQLPEL